MAKEIERKFLVDLSKLSLPAGGEKIAQGYFKTDASVVVRVRIRGAKAMLTIKGKTEGLSRSEFEYEIPMEDATAMLKEFCGGQTVEKTRYEIEYASMLWELDIFEGENKGLVVAEIELENEQQDFARPPWLADEVSGQTQYYNNQLLRKPYSSWKA